MVVWVVLVLGEDDVSCSFVFSPRVLNSHHHLFRMVDIATLERLVQLRHSHHFRLRKVLVSGSDSCSRLEVVVC